MYTVFSKIQLSVTPYRRWKAFSFIIFFFLHLSTTNHYDQYIKQICLSFFMFLDASSHLYMRVCPSVRRYVRRYVRRSVGPSVRRSVGSSHVIFERRKSWILCMESPQMIRGKSKKSAFWSRPLREVLFFAWCSACPKYHILSIFRCCKILTIFAVFHGKFWSEKISSF